MRKKSPRQIHQNALGNQGIKQKHLHITAVVFMDAIHYHVRSEGQIVKKAVYIAIGVNLEGRKSVLGMWVGENESEKFWASVLNSLKNRKVEDILIACTDNLTGFSEAIAAVFPKTDIQNCRLYPKICVNHKRALIEISKLRNILMSPELIHSNTNQLSCQ